MDISDVLKCCFAVTETVWGSHCIAYDLPAVVTVYQKLANPPQDDIDDSSSVFFFYVVLKRTSGEKWFRNMSLFLAISCRRLHLLQPNSIFFLVPMTCLFLCDGLISLSTVLKDWSFRPTSSQLSCRVLSTAGSKDKWRTWAVHGMHTQSMSLQFLTASR